MSLLASVSIPETQGLKSERTGIRIGAALTWAQLIKSNLPPAFDALKKAGRQVGSVQIQNAATVVGNLCNASPAADDTCTFGAECRGRAAQRDAWATSGSIDGIC